LVGDEGDEMRSFVNDAIIQDVQTLIVGRIGAPFAGPENVSSSHELVRIGDIGDLGEMLHIKAVDQVMFFPPFHDPSSSSEALKECEALGVPACFYVHVGRPLISVPRLISLHRRPFFIFELAPKRPEMLALKYTFDTLSAAFGLLVISPLLFVTGLLILITMGRPVFFSQVRSGLFGREFHMHKFRTMVKGAESRRDELKTKNEMDGPVFKITHDPRVTRLGRFLRKWSIDELPQLFNVLVGDMSLVGPRPLPIREQKEIVGWQRRRLSMRPGITGLWQVSGRNDVNFEQWMKLDLEYVDRWSFWTDCKILMKTVRVVLTGKGAS
jgi:exopolysaccharide biosynthesis polyprenyl glycosylphosphotransferase